jgi:parallel beta-helix repeat protein
VAAVTSSAANALILPGLNLICTSKPGQPVVLDATKLDHAVYISGINRITVDGCVAENASREGILVENAFNVHIVNNNVRQNDQAMAINLGQGTPPCPTFMPPSPSGALQCCPDAFSGGPGNFPDDNDDCGEAIHLRSVSNSVVEANKVHHNVGGILLSDETGPNHGNLIANNDSSKNTLFGGDCGITLASHVGCTPGSTDATGCGSSISAGGSVFQNAVVGNILNGNGASGVGMFANPGIPPGSATEASDNLISENVVTNNGQPGIAIHVHAANGAANHNMIVENIVSGNGGDSEAEGVSPPNTGIEVLSNGDLGAPFLPAAPIGGTIISQNSVSGEKIDLWVGNTATFVSAFLNNLKGKNSIGVDNTGTGFVIATDDYWGCANGPGNTGCSSTMGNVVRQPFLSAPVNPEQ